MGVFNMTYVKTTIVHKLKNSENHPVYEDKSDSRRSGNSYRNTYMKLYNHNNFCEIWVCYIIVGQPWTFTKKLC